MKSRDLLTKYFDFEGIGILFRDVRTNDLFSIEQTFNEVEYAYLKEFEDKKRRGIKLTIEERQNDFERQM